MLLDDYEKSKIKVYLDKDQEAIDITKKMVENLASDEEYEEIVVHKKYVPQIRMPSTKNQPKLIEIPNVSIRQVFLPLHKPMCSFRISQRKNLQK